jgi:hypothetical protein
MHQSTIATGEPIIVSDRFYPFVFSSRDNIRS